jgi:hypothetical protein
MADIFLIKKIISFYLCGINPTEVDIPGYNRKQINRHLEMLDGDENELAGMLCNDFVWNELTSKFSHSELDSMPLSVIKDMAIRLTKRWAESRLELA